MIPTLAELLARAAQLRNHHGQLRAILDRREAAPTVLADRKRAELREYEPFALSPPEFQDRAVSGYVQALQADLTTAAGIDLFYVETEAPRLAQALAQAKAEARRAPDPVTWHLRRTGGHRLSLGDGTELAIRQYDVTTRTYLLAATKDWTPSRLADEYGRALASDSDEAGAMVRFIEEVGYRGTPASRQDIAEAARLRRMVDEAQAGRVPTDLATVEADIEDALKLANRAKTLYRVTPLDPDQAPEAQEVHAQQVLEALAEEGVGA